MVQAHVPDILTTTLINFLATFSKVMQYHWVKLQIGFIWLNMSKLSSPHIHMLICLEYAPRFGIDSDKKVIGFVKKVISCQKPMHA